MNKQAHFSEDGKHRFWLLRSWEENPKMITYIGLNPSTADAENDDPTISSLIRITKFNGYGGFVMCNLFTFIATNPELLIANLQHAFNQESEDALERMIRNIYKTVCAWGSWPQPEINARAKDVLNRIQNPFCLGVTMNGSPKHPCRKPSKTWIIPFNK